MGIGESLKVVGAGMAWRAFGVDAAGRALLDSMAEGREQERMLAGMSLVKGGRRSIDLIDEAVSTGEASPYAVKVLADIGGPRCRALLTDIASKPDELGTAATEALDLLNRIDSLDED